MALWLKSNKGKWLEGEVVVEKETLKWQAKDDPNGEDPEVSITLNESLNIKPIMFGIRKHVFEVCMDEKVFQFSAKSDDERNDWVEKLSKTAGITRETKKPRKSGANRNPSSVKVAGLQQLLQGLPGGGSLGGGMMTKEEATKKLQDKLKGKVTMESQISEKGCVVCKFRIDKADILTLPRNLGVAHQTCFYCAKCGDNLTEDGFRLNKKEGKFYCIDHFEGVEEEEEEEKATVEDDEGREPDEKEVKEDSNEDEKKSTTRVVEEPEPDAKKDNGLSHAAVLSRPTVRGGRRPPGAQRRPPAAVNVPDSDKEHHFNSFQIVGGKKGAEKLLCFCPHLMEKRQWVDTICNALEVLRLKKELEEAQRVDMFSAIQAQMNLENFEQTHKSSIAGELLVCIRKKAKDTNTKWKKAYVNLGADMTISVFETVEKASTPDAKPLFRMDLHTLPKIFDGNSKNEISFAIVKAERKSQKDPSPNSKKRTSSASSKRKSSELKSSDSKKEEVSDPDVGSDDEDNESRSKSQPRTSSPKRSDAEALTPSTVVSEEDLEAFEEADRKAEEVVRTGFCGPSCTIM